MPRVLRRNSCVGAQKICNEAYFQPRSRVKSTVSGEQWETALFWALVPGLMEVVLGRSSKKASVKIYTLVVPPLSLSLSLSLSHPHSLSLLRTYFATFHNKHNYCFASTFRLYNTLTIVLEKYFLLSEKLSEEQCLIWFSRSFFNFQNSLRKRTILKYKKKYVYQKLDQFLKNVTRVYIMN